MPRDLGGPNFLYPAVMEEFGSTQLNRAVSNVVRKLRMSQPTEKYVANYLENPPK